MANEIVYKEPDYNPRNITSGQHEDLKQWLDELGDLSGIIYNVRTKQFPGGNQRSKAMDFNQCKKEYYLENKKPDRQGTLKLGYIIWKRAKYSFRVVDWTEEQERKANIIANKAGGDWDWEKLQSSFTDIELLDWGFDEKEINNIFFKGHIYKEGALEGDFTGGNITDNNQYAVIVLCTGEDDQVKIFNDLQKSGLTCKIVVT